MEERPAEDTHPYAAYNKDAMQGTPTLVGNWVEERSLKEATGTGRYEPWVSREEQTSIYTTRQDHAAQMPTHPRVIEHTHIAQEPQNWRTMYGASYRHPQQASQLLEYKNQPHLGPRAKRDMEALRQVAAGSLAAETREPANVIDMTLPPELDTTYTASFTPQDLTANTIGARVMKEHDGRPRVHDPTFLAETQMVPRPLGDRLFGETAKLAGAAQTTVLANPDIPITIYSEAVATRTYGGNIYGTRPIAHAASPFGKYSNFSKPMSEYNKVVVDE